MFPQRLKEERNKRGLSQMEFSKIIGVSQQTIGSWETGRTSPDYESLNKIADFFDVSTDYLLCRPERIYGNKRKIYGNHTPIYGKDKEPEESPSYYSDPETLRLANQLKDDPDYRTLFHAKKKLPPEKMEVYMEMLKGMIGEND